METVSGVAEISALKVPQGGLADWFLRTSHDLNAAVRTFVQQYELRHRASLDDLKLERENLVEGTYYVSGILRLNFSYKQAGKSSKCRSSAILKVPQLGASPMHGEYMLAYEKEKFVYEILLPIMYASWPGDKVMPEFYGATECGILALENLKESGYYQKPNGSLVGFRSCQTVLKALAQFHALSLKHMSRMMEELDSLTVVDRSEDEWPAKIYPAMLRKLKRNVLPSCSSRTRELLDEYLKKMHSVFEAGQSPNEGGFNVILHGQTHCYNLLLKDDQRNVPKWCKLIDFQSTRRGSPILDIMLFFVTSARCEMVRKNRVALFNCYLNEFKNILKQTEPSRSFSYTFQDLWQDFQTYRLQFLYPLICIVPLYWAGNSSILNLGNNEDDVDAILKSEKYITFFKSWIKFLLYPKV